MAHGNEVWGPLGSHHAGDLRDGQDIALGDLSPLNLFKGFWLEKDCGLSRRSPFSRVFGADVNHPRPPRLVEVRKFCHLLARTIHKYLLRRPILLPGGAFLVRPPQRTASTPTSASLARSPGGRRSRTPRDGIHEQSGPAKSARYNSILAGIIGAGGKGSQGRGRAACWPPVLAQRAA
jgi:hypothetical protein